MESKCQEFLVIGHLIFGNGFMVIGHDGFLVFGQTNMISSILISSIHLNVLLTLVFVYVAHRTHNMKNLWSLTIKNA